MPKSHGKRTSLPKSVPGEVRSIAAGRFKAECLRLMDEVNGTGAEIIITKRNRPVARLAPVSDADLRPFVGRSRGVIRATRAAVLAPLDPDWEPGADL